MNEDFDGWLERQLASDFTELSRTAVPRALSRPSSYGRKRMRLVPALPAAVSAKAIAGFTVVALAAGGGAAAVSDATGHSTFGKDVAQKAQWCAQHMSKGEIGDCVSDFVLAPNPGASHRSTNAQPDAASHGSSGAGHSNSGSNPAGAPPANPSNASTTHKPPVSHPTGKP
jgi:hypothetical protein